MSYKTNTEAQLWTKIGNKAGTTRVGTIVDVSGNSMLIKEHIMWEISSSNYAGKYIEPKYLTEVVDVPPTPEVATIVLTEPDGTIRLFKEVTNANIR